MAASGIGLHGSTDPFVWNKLRGDFILRARVELIGAVFDPQRKFGWRVQPAPGSGAAFVEAFGQGNGVSALQFRRVNDAKVGQIILPIKDGNVLQLERRGNAFIFSAANNEEPFGPVAQIEIDLGEDVHARLFLDSEKQPDKARAVFHEVSFIRPAQVGFRPYHDYIGSRLEILDICTGKIERVHSSTEPFEAPNWMPDGKTLIYNVSGFGPNKGRLCTFDLETRTVALLDTAFAIHNNNDHVLSFDGQQLAISHHSPDDGGRSVIYTLPATGGTPKRVTPNAPSYLHGWSPDSHWLVYTGGRKQIATEPDKYDIYKIPVIGGAEIRLTSAPGLNDGPEFSPDGQFIYFNSSRSGLMQLWRMKPDGSDEVQITNDGFNNWFPHISPDGKWIVFLSFGQDVKPDDHPYYKQVYLRLMPVTGGQPKVIAYVYGGQGTINVPSWSPDSRRIAFVSNSAEF